MATQLTQETITNADARHADLNEINPTTIRTLAGVGLDYIKNICNKTKITPADALERFLGNYQCDQHMRTPLFCLTITMLSMSKDGLDTDVYNKLFSQVVKQFEDYDDDE